MKKGSLVVMSPRFFKELPRIKENYNVKFRPSEPTKRDSFVCITDPYNNMGRECIKVDDLKMFIDSNEVDLNTYLFIEVQPPTKVDIQELIKEKV